MYCNSSSSFVPIRHTLHLLSFVQVHNAENYVCMYVCEYVHRSWTHGDTVCALASRTTQYTVISFAAITYLDYLCSC